MKKTICILAATALLLPASLAAADTPCKKREAAIEAELALAKQNNAPTAGLEEALANHKLTCNDSDLVSKMEMKVEEKKLKVSKAEIELKEAKASGKADKIAKKEAKLQEARIDLREAEADLAALR